MKLNWYKKSSIFKYSETSSVYDLLDEGENIPSNEILYDFIDQDKLHIQLSIKVVDNPKTLMTHKGDMTVWNSYQFANDQSKELIEYYSKRKPFNNIIITDGNKVIDGNHRVIASIIGQWQLKTIDISDLDSKKELSNELV